MNQKAIVKKVIVTDLTTRGKGVEGDPMRTVTQYWDLDGKLLAEIDLSDKTKERIIERLETEYEKNRDLAKSVQGHCKEISRLEHINNQFRAQLGAIKPEPKQKPLWKRWIGKLKRA